MLTLTGPLSQQTFSMFSSGATCPPSAGKAVGTPSTRFTAIAPGREYLDRSLLGSFMMSALVPSSYVMWHSLVAAAGGQGQAGGGRAWEVAAPQRHRRRGTTQLAAAGEQMKGDGGAS